MAVLSANDLDRFTPAHRANEPIPPVYLVAPMRLRQRAMWRAELARRGAGRISTNEDLVRAVRDAVEEVAPDNLAECLEAVDAMLALIAAPPPEPPPAEGAGPDPERDAEDGRRQAVLDAYDAVERAMNAHPRVANMLAERVMFNIYAPFLAASISLRGWENVAVPFDRRGEMVPEDVLERLDERDLLAVGTRALELMRVSEADRKN